MTLALAIVAPTLTDRAAEAKQLGRTAFNTGRMRVPAMDPKVLPLISGMAIGRGPVIVLDAWLQGWDGAMVQSWVDDDDTLPEPSGTDALVY